MEQKTCVKLRFDEKIQIYYADSYDRTCEFIWKTFTDEDKLNIRKEINAFKSEMTIHKDSRRFTRFHI